MQMRCDDAHQTRLQEACNLLLLRVQSNGDEMGALVTRESPPKGPAALIRPRGMWGWTAAGPRRWHRRPVHLLLSPPGTPKRSLPALVWLPSFTRAHTQKKTECVFLNTRRNFAPSFGFGGFYGNLVLRILLHVNSITRQFIHVKKTNKKFS